MFLLGSFPCTCNSKYYLGHSSFPRWHATMRAARRQGMLEVVCCGTESSSRVRARAPPVQHILRVNVAYMCFKADENIMDALVRLSKKKGAGGRGEATAGEPILETALWGMLYADDTEIVSQSPEQLEGNYGGVHGRACGVWPHRIGCQD